MQGISDSVCSKHTLEPKAHCTASTIISCESSFVTHSICHCVCREMPGLASQPLWRAITSTFTAQVKNDAIEQAAGRGG